MPTGPFPILAILLPMIVLSLLAGLLTFNLDPKSLLPAVGTQIAFAFNDLRIAPFSIKSDQWMLDSGDGFIRFFERHQT
jgi:hypothetical protein